MRALDMLAGAVFAVLALAVSVLIFVAGSATGVDIVISNCKQHSGYSTGTDRIRCEVMK